jgi:NADH-ubiquinone oxidoreductase chain 4
MVLMSLLVIPFIGIFIISCDIFYYKSTIKKVNSVRSFFNNKGIALITSILNMLASFILFILYDFNNNQFQFVQEHYTVNIFDIYLGVDGLSIYFVLLTTIIMPIAILSN